ncbi:3-deoxy-D-manno-octulosonic acid transferase [Xanthobacter sp. TB0136]|uniref:3-deoxy-D-manno-octulosonic acid transferase n=1 Tax=Xanthobacter sp. TB0136 TaxID=3459177 RepID=UPI00403A11F3
MKARGLPFTLRLYRGASTVASLLTPAWLGYRVSKGKEDPERIGERRGIASAERPEGPLVWVHGASVGEVNCVLPLVGQLRARGYAVLLTSGTLTSSRLVERRAPEGVIHQFCPLDATIFISRFLDHWQPDLVLLAESELWPNLLTELGRRNTPTVLVNGRLSARSARRWQRMPKSARALLSRIDLCLAQSELDGERFRTLGTERVDVSGNLKFDVPPPGADALELDAMTRALGRRPVMLAASTHAGEDEMVIAAHMRLREEFPGLITIIAPRHPERGGNIAALGASAGLDTAQRAIGHLPEAETELYVADTIGELGLFYRIAPASFIGGSLVPHGGQNPIEAVQLGTVVIHGPHVHNFSDIYTALDNNEGAVAVHDADSLTLAAKTLLSDARRHGRTSRKAAEVLENMGGALDRTLRAIEPYLLHIRLQHQ